MKILKKILMGAVILGGLVGFNVSAATLQGYQGGTGYGSTIAGNVGKCLQVSTTSPWLAWTIGNCGGGTFTTSTLAGLTDTFWNLLSGNNLIEITTSTSPSTITITATTTPSFSSLTIGGSATSTITGDGTASTIGSDLALNGTVSLPMGNAINFVTGGGIYFYPDNTFVSPFLGIDSAATNTLTLYAGAGGGAGNINLDYNSLTTDQTFTFPDQSGTFALTSDLPSGGTNFWTLNGTSLYPTSTSYSVGIGTTTPSVALSVVGDAKISGTVNVGAGGAYQINGVNMIYATGTNYFFGDSGNTTATGTYNVGLGTQTLHSLTSGNYNSAYNINSLYNLTTGNYNTAFGGYSLYNIATGSTNVALGNYAGYNETGSNAFYIGNIQQSSLANDKAYSLLYGNFAGTAGTTANQFLTVNGSLGINTPSPSTPLHVIGTTTISNGNLKIGSSTNGIAFSDGSIQKTAIQSKELLFYVPTSTPQSDDFWTVLPATTTITRIYASHYKGTSATTTGDTVTFNIIADPNGGSNTPSSSSWKVFSSDITTSNSTSTYYAPTGSSTLNQYSHVRLIMSNGSTTEFGISFMGYQQ